MGRPLAGAAAPAGEPGPGSTRRATEFIDGHADRDIGLAEIAAAAGVGTRGLQSGFQRHLGTTPLAYLRDVRLDRAHHDLLHADPALGTTVAGVAARWRFRHAGRFSVAYRRRYGRHPSEILHQDGAAGSPENPVLTPDEGVEVALLDPAGVIVWVNAAWEEFRADHGGDPARTGPCSSYLAVCDAADDPGSAATAVAIRTALRGRLPAPARIRIPCPTPQRVLMYDVLVSTRRADDGRVLGATVTLGEAGTAAHRPPPTSA